MELRIPADELARALSMVSGVVQRKNTMPILANVLLDVSTTEDGKGQVTLSATDLDVGMRTIRPCEAVQDGSVTILARALSDMVKVLPGPDVTLKKLPNQHVEVKSGRTQARLLALSADEFPRLPQFEDVQFATLDCKLFSDMLGKTLYSASTDDSRYNLTGVYFEPQGDGKTLSMVSTDGHRLSKVERAFDDVNFDPERKMILPRKGLGELLRILDDASLGGDSFELGFTQNQAVARRGHTVLSMRLIDGNFPDYHQVIPNVSDKVVRVPRAEMVDSLKRVSVLASDKTQSVKLTLENGKLTVACKNPDAGEVSDDVPMEYDGDDIEVAFNARYLIEALNSLDDQNVLIKLTDGLSPGLLVGADEPHHLCVIMPMRV
jgi:DNA polymerase-3 subunit beta